MMKCDFIRISPVFSFLLAGCISVPNNPVPKDPFSGLFDAAPAAYPNLTAAVFISENTRNSVQYGMESARLLPGASGLVQSMLDRNFESFKKNFKAVIRIEKLEEASKTGADLVAVIDFLVQSKGRFRIHNGLVFMTLEGRTIDTLQVDVERRFSALNPMGPIQEASNEAQEKILSALRNSIPLAEFAKAKGGTSGEAAAPALAKTYHSDVDTPGYGSGDNPDDFALIVGVEKYQNLPSADFAERDAAAVRKHLRALGYPERNIITLTGPKASRTGIEKYIETWLPINVKESSRVFVYFSGHGAPDAVTGQAYLVPWDGDAQFLKNTGYPIKRLYQNLNDLKSSRVVLAMDACFSGEGGRSVLAKGTRPLVTKVDVGVETTGKLVVFAATAVNEITASEESQGHGLFTYYFLKGLQEKNGKATVKGLYDYVLPRVRDAAHRDGREQTPQLMPADIGVQGSTFL